MVGRVVLVAELGVGLAEDEDRILTRLKEKRAVAIVRRVERLRRVPDSPMRKTSASHPDLWRGIDHLRVAPKLRCLVIRTRLRGWHVGSPDMTADRLIG